MADLELPDEVTEALASHEERNEERLKALELALIGKRSEAIAARKSSGIEEVWFKAEEAYLGIDATNRGSFQNAKWAKPTTMDSPIKTETARRNQGEVQSTAFVRLTSRYVDAGAAKLSEILLPADEKAFSFTNTPVPEIITKLKDTSQAIHNGVPLERDPRPGELAPGAALPGAVPSAPIASAAPAASGPLPNMGTGIPNPGIPITVKDLAEEAIEKASASAKKAEKRIHDWMVESRFRAEGRKVVFDASRCGVGVLKGPFPRESVSKAYDEATKSIKVNRKVVPAYAWTDFWNIYPDPACGESIRDGDHLFEYDQFTQKQLRKLKGAPGYNAKAIDFVISQGPMGASKDSIKPGETLNKFRYPIWHYYGTIKREDMIAAGGLKPDQETDKTEFYAICTIANDTLIRATINPLDSGEMPYHSVPWQRRPGHWAGVGVGEQLEMPQNAINAAIRALFNNAGKSAGSIIVHDQGSIVPADGSPVVTPDKLYYRAPDSTVDDIRKAFAFFSVPNMTPQLMQVIDLCLKLAEEVTNIPLVTQGQSGTTSPETYGATQLQNNNANQLLRSIGYAFDDYITEPVVNQSYEYLLLDPKVPADEKGDWHIDAHGSVALVERAIQDETVTQMGQFAIQPAFGVDPKRWFAEFSKTKRLNPKNFQYTPEEQAKIDAQPKPAAPAIEVAKIRSADADKALAAEDKLAQMQAQLDKAIADAANATKESVAALKKEMDEKRIVVDTDRDRAYVEAETARTTNQHLERMKELEIKERLATLEYANKRELNLNDVKADLAKTSMTLNVQRELAAADRGAEVAKAAAEPPGKASPGKGFTE